MPVWSICGGHSLSGKHGGLQGAKNAVLLDHGGLPARRRRHAAQRLITALRDVGGLEGDPCATSVCGVMQNGGGDSGRCLRDAREPHPARADERMRSSVMYLGAILARCGEARLSAPAGCELGARPIRPATLKALQALGAEVETRGGESRLPVRAPARRARQSRSSRASARRRTSCSPRLRGGGDDRACPTPRGSRRIGESATFSERERREYPRRRNAGDRHRRLPPPGVHRPPRDAGPHRGGHLSLARPRPRAGTFRLERVCPAHLGRRSPPR
jgi:hypothetical protein